MRELEIPNRNGGVDKIEVWEVERSKYDPKIMSALVQICYQNESRFLVTKWHRALDRKKIVG